MQPAILGLSFETKNLDPVGEIFLWSLFGGLGQRPLALSPEKGSFQVKVTEPAAFVVISFQASFDDVATHWARRDILLLNLQGIVRGVSHHQFEPDRVVTRAEFTALLLRYFDIEEKRIKESAFTDVNPDKWYYSIINTAFMENLVSGYDGIFEPDRVVSREEAAILLIRAQSRVHTFEGMDSSQVDETLSVFVDADLIADWAREAVA